MTIKAKGQTDPPKQESINEVGKKPTDETEENVRHTSISDLEIT